MVPGMSAQVRRSVLKRHFASILCFFICSGYLFATSLVYVTYPDYRLIENLELRVWWKDILKLLFYSEGYLSVLIRCTEESFKSAIKRRVIDFKLLLSCEKTKFRGLDINE